jgi:hypothetical protein
MINFLNIKPLYVSLPLYLIINKPLLLVTEGFLWNIDYFLHKLQSISKLYTFQCLYLAAYHLLLPQGKDKTLLYPVW